MLHRISLVVVEASLHGYHLFATKCSKEQLSGMAFYRRNGKVRNIIVGDAVGHFNFIGQVAEPEIPEGLRQQFDEVIQAQQEWRDAEAQWSESRDQLQQIRSRMDGLDERSREILTQRWLGEKKATLHELADRYSVSAERVRKIPMHRLLVGNPLARALRRGLVPKAVRTRIRKGRTLGDRPRLPADLERVIDAAGVSRTVLVQTLPSVDETRWFLELADAHEFIAGVVGWVDLTDPGVGDQLDQLREGTKLVGVRLAIPGEADEAWIVRDDLLRGMDELSKRGLTLDLLLQPGQLKHVPTLAGRVPELPLVIDHLAKPPIRAGRFDGWREAMSAAAAFPNVHGKLSGLITEADHEAWQPADLKPYVDHAVECFGFDRLMFGSDWPVCLLAGAYAQVLEALARCLGALSRADADDLYHETARRCYALKPGLPR